MNRFETLFRETQHENVANQQICMQQKQIFVETKLTESQLFDVACTGSSQLWLLIRIWIPLEKYIVQYRNLA